MLILPDFGADPGFKTPVGANFGRFWCRHPSSNTVPGAKRGFLPLATGKMGCRGQNGVYLPLGGSCWEQKGVFLFPGGEKMGCRAQNGVLVCPGKGGFFRVEGIWGAEGYMA